MKTKQERIIEILKNHYPASIQTHSKVADAILAIEQKESKSDLREEICSCEDGGTWLDGYYDTHCDRCKKHLP